MTLPPEIEQAIDKLMSAFFNAAPFDRVRQAYAAREALVLAIRRALPQERVTPEDATATIALEALARRQGDHDLRHARYGPPLMSDCKYVCTEWRDLAAIRAALSGLPLVSVSPSEEARLLEEAAYLETEAAENSSDVSRLLEVMRGAAARLRGVAVDFAPPKEGNNG